MMTQASHTLPSSHSRCRSVRARRVDGSKLPTVVAERPLDHVVEPDWLARDADGKQLFAGPELFGRELERLEHAKPQLPLEVHPSDKHRNGGSTTEVRTTGGTEALASAQANSST